MYADGFAPRRLNRGSLGLSVGIVASLLVATVLAPPVVQQIVHPKRLVLIDIQPLAPPPKPEPIPKPQPRTVPQPISQITPIVPTPAKPVDTLPLAPAPTPTADGGLVAGSGPITIPTPEPTRVAPPVLVGPEVDARYVRDLQPGYPSAEERAGNNGVVTLRVLVGIDGRVRQVEEVSATSDEFWRATQRQALAKWRFRPATRDGIPTEGWRTMTVRFNLADAQ